MAHVTVAEMIWRILAAFVAGWLVGWERESHGRPAGLRTNILACVASAVAMLVSLLLEDTAGAVTAPAVRADVTRIPMGIMAGIGFLGGGTILRHGDFVRGVTTAASLWFVTILGLAFGCGFYALGFVGLAVAMGTLVGLSRFESLVDSHWYARLSVTATLDGPSETELQNRIEGHGPTVLSMKLEYDLEKRQKTFGWEVRCKRRQRFEIARRLLTSLAQVPGVLRAGWD